jgi:predicted GIY-YIG superfamily endonuclease
VFRLAGKAFGRLKGESDLVYIGYTESVKRRLSYHLPARADEQKCADRLRNAGRVGALEVAWRSHGSVEEARCEEARLLRRYYWDHGELPPVNRGEPAPFVRKAIEHLSESDLLKAKESLSEPQRRGLAERAVEDVVRQGRTKKSLEG